MPDTYPNFAALSASEPPGEFAIRSRDTSSHIVIAAPHGGAIEPGTSEIALAIAQHDLSYYLFEGHKRAGNAALHLASTRFDEPRCLALLASAQAVLTVHGESSAEEAVFLGGRNASLRAAVSDALEAAGFRVSEHADPDLQGVDPANLCNLGSARAGVQLELARGLRQTMFESLDRAGRTRPTLRLRTFATALRSALPLTVV